MWISRDVAVPLREVVLRTSRSSGPGGQHANVTESRVEAVFDVAASASLSEAQKARIMARCGPVVRAVAQDARSQARNRELALERLRARLTHALEVPAHAAPDQARARGAKARRVEAKRRAVAAQARPRVAALPERRRAGLRRRGPYGGRPGARTCSPGARRPSLVSRR